MTYYIIAGEASGDLHASNLMRAIQRRDVHAEFRAWGGDLMQEAGAKLVRHYRDLAFMGFWEVLKHLRIILNNLKFCKEDITAYKPDVLILVDYPGFNLRIAEWAHKQGYRVVYYISPQVWAWNRKRVHKIKRIVAQMLVILPFEKAFYAEYDYSVDFVGHPLLDVIDGEENTEKLREELGLTDERIIALLPGSRKQEIRRMLPIMLSTAKALPNYTYVVGGAPSVEPEFYQPILAEHNAKFIYNQTYDLLRCADAALVTSGTATLETALFSVPQVVCYRGNWLSYWLARQLVKVNYIALVNLIMDKPVVRELIQGNFNKEQLTQALKNILNPIEQERIQNDYTALRKRLGGVGASDRAAQQILRNE